MLISFQAFISIDRMVEKYENSLNSDYSIVVVANELMSDDVFNDNISTFASSTQIKIDDVLQKLKDNISESNIALLKVSMPKFYQIRLTSFPSNEELKKIESNLNSITSVMKIETFTKTHDNIYKMFLLSKGTVTFFSLLLVVVSIFLIIKQIEVWHYQHSSRLHIMSLLGAGTFMKSKVLFSLAMSSSLLSTMIVGLFFWWLSISKQISAILTQIGLSNIEFTPQYDMPILFAISYSTSILILLVVLIRHKN
jgi:cell division transport system permease protein